jgi:hypothetical protein
MYCTMRCSGLDIACGYEKGLVAGLVVVVVVVPWLGLNRFHRTEREIMDLRRCSDTDSDYRGGSGGLAGSSGVELP